MIKIISGQYFPRILGMHRLFFINNQKNRNKAYENEKQSRPPKIEEIEIIPQSNYKTERILWKDARERQKKTRGSSSSRYIETITSKRSR